MKRVLILALVLGLVAGAMAAPATAKKKKKKKPVKIERTVEVPYSFPSAIGTSGAGGCSGCPSVPTGSGERYAMVEIVDDAMPNAGAEFSWDTNGDGVSDTGFTVCGSTEEPIEVPEATEITAFTWPVTGPACPGGGATSGTIKITYSNMP